MNIAKSLQQREILGPTGIGNGVAIPHVKISGLTKIYGFFYSLERPIDFESADKQPVDLIFTLLARKIAMVLNILKQPMVSRVFSDKDIRAKLVFRKYWIFVCHINKQRTQSSLKLTLFLIKIDPYGFSTNYIKFFIQIFLSF